MKIFLKKIKSQEWGYRKGIPNKGGKYLLIPTSCWDFFPDLSSGIRNSFATIRVQLPNGLHVGLFYVWNNTFLFPELGLDRDHNERRLYSSKLMQEELSLDKDVLICFARKNDSENDWFFANRSDADLTNYKEVEILFEKYKPIHDNWQGARCSF